MSRESTERLRKIDRIFQNTLDRPPAERSGYLARACAGDEGLRRRVRRLLAADERANTFLERPAAHAPRRFPGNRGHSRSAETWTWGLHPPPRRPRRRRAGPEEGTIGPYQLLRQIGRGGMSAVYLARRSGAPSRPVALKILHRGLNDAETLRRFRRERLLLARLRHPLIARLGGGGTAQDGRPYLIMEYVRGWPIDEYCDRRRLSVTDRLELFRKVCGAVQYAHRRHLVHRDLKPDNILVTENGTPKLLDFGIAKLLDKALIDLTMESTRAGVRLMTPGYASPEQVQGLRITPASDIYSLGVLLYRLLTGRGPYRPVDDRPHRLGLAICGQEPVRPSEVVGQPEVLPGGARVTPESVSRARSSSPRRLRRRLRGDVDAIVARALAKQPAERYGSAAELAADVVRHLSDRPVRARPGTLPYLAGKFVRRRRFTLAAALTVLGALLVWLAAIRI